MTRADETLAQQGRYVQLNDLNMYYEEYGSGKPLILIHGGTQTTRSWEAHTPFFSRHFRVVALDSRGHGKTDNPAGELSYRLMGDDVAVFVQTLGLTKPFICGWSDGGQIALEIGMRYPDLAGALIIGGAGHILTSEFSRKTLREWGIEGPGLVNLAQIERVWTGYIETLSELHSPIYGPDYWKTLLRQLSIMWLTPLGYTTEDFQKIIAPTLILLGDRDQLLPIEEVVEMYRLILPAELAILPNSDHDLPSAKIELFLNIVLEFLLHHSTQAEDG